MLAKEGEKKNHSKILYFLLFLQVAKQKTLMDKIDFGEKYIRKEKVGRDKGRWQKGNHIHAYYLILWVCKVKDHLFIIFKDYT